MKELYRSTVQPVNRARTDQEQMTTTLFHRLTRPVAKSCKNSKRMGRDSNPRYGFPYSSFQDCRLSPLGHPSKTNFMTVIFSSRLVYKFACTLS